MKQMVCPHEKTAIFQIWTKKEGLGAGTLETLEHQKDA
jgi:hypothetical protein